MGKIDFFQLSLWKYGIFKYCFSWGSYVEKLWTVLLFLRGNRKGKTQKHNFTFTVGRCSLVVEVHQCGCANTLCFNMTVGNGNKITKKNPPKNIKGVGGGGTKLSVKGVKCYCSRGKKVTSVTNMWHTGCSEESMRLGCKYPHRPSSGWHAILIPVLLSLNHL